MVLTAVFTGCKFYHISRKTKEIVKKLEIEDKDDLKFVELAVENLHGARLYDFFVVLFQV
jgi:hypothetical protein